MCIGNGLDWPECWVVWAIRLKGAGKGITIRYFVEGVRVVWPVCLYTINKL